MSLRNPDDKPRDEPAADDQHPSGAFPQDPSEFDSDPRVSFSQLDNRFILETEDGQEFEYDTALKRWVLTVRPSLASAVFIRGACTPGILPKAVADHCATYLQVDDALLEQQRQAYKVEGVDEDESVTSSQLKKKRKHGEDVRSLSLPIDQNCSITNSNMAFSRRMGRKRRRRVSTQRCLSRQYPSIPR